MDFAALREKALAWAAREGKGGAVADLVVECAKLAPVITPPELRHAGDNFVSLRAHWRALLARSTDMDACDADPLGDSDQHAVEAALEGTAGHTLLSTWCDGCDINLVTSMGAAAVAKGVVPAFFAGILFGMVAKVQAALAAAKAEGEAALHTLLESRFGVLRLTPLMFATVGARRDAAGTSHVAIAKALVAAGARIDARDILGCTALHHATTSMASAQSLEIGALLLSRTNGHPRGEVADPDALNRIGRVAMFQAVMGARNAPTLGAVILLAEAGANASIVEPVPTVDHHGRALTTEQKESLFSCPPLSLPSLTEDMRAAITSAHKRQRMGARSLLTGSRVRLAGLKAAELNGKAGVCGALDVRAMDGSKHAPRYSVALDGGRTVAVKVQNVMPEGLTLPDDPTVDPALSKPCAACGKPGAPQRCAGCLGPAYCNKECQKVHWKRHKKECTGVEGKAGAGGGAAAAASGGGGAPAPSYADVVVIRMPGKQGASITVPRASMLRAAAGSGPLEVHPSSSPSKAAEGKLMVLKVQVPMVPGPFPLMVYNEDRSLQFHLNADEAGYARLSAAVRSKGMMGGVKAYFEAACVGGNMRINVSKALPAQPW